MIEHSICHNACMATLSIRKKVNEYETVVKSYGRFVWDICLVCCPVADVFQKISELDANLKRVNTNIFLGPAKRSRPSPYLTKQVFMEIEHKSFRKHVNALLPREPEQSGLNVGLLQFVQLLAGGHMRMTQAFQFVRIKLRCTFWFFKPASHSLSQRSVGISEANWLARRSIFFW